MRKIIITLAAFAAACSAPAQKQKPAATKQAAAAMENDTFFIIDPRDAEYARNHPETMAKADADRQLLRNEEYKQTGVKWMALKDAGPEARGMILNSDPGRREDLRRNGLNIDVAYADFDHDGKADLVFYNWGDGRADGYTYTVVFGNTKKPNRLFFGMMVRPYKNGILVDKAYSVL